MRVNCIGKTDSTLTEGRHWRWIVVVMDISASNVSQCAVLFITILIKYYHTLMAQPTSYSLIQVKGGHRSIVNQINYTYHFDKLHTFTPILWHLMQYIGQTKNTILVISKQNVTSIYQTKLFANTWVDCASLWHIPVY